MKTDIERAREIVAGQFFQSYHINAIMSGDWDTGWYVQNALCAVREDREACSNAAIP